MRRFSQKGDVETTRNIVAKVNTCCEDMFPEISLISFFKFFSERRCCEDEAVDLPAL